MRTKKAEIASQKQIGDAEPVTVSTERVTDEVMPVEDIPQVKEYQVFVRFAIRENAENFKFKLKSLGYDNAELSEVWLMPTEVAQNVYLNYGVLGCVIVSFFILIWWVVKTSKEREDKLYGIIETLSKELPEIRKNLEEIKDKLFDD